MIVAALVLVACTDGRRPRDGDDDDDDDWDNTGYADGGSYASGGGGFGGGQGGGQGGCGGGAKVPVNPGDLVITEIMNNPASITDDAGEWFEIHNASGHSIDLSGFVIQHQLDDASPHVVTGSFVVAAGAYVVLGRNADTATNGNVVVDYAYAGEINLHNASDYLGIETPEGLLIDATSWDESSGLDPDGSSRTLDALFTSAAMNDDDTHFCEGSSAISGSSDYGTPGAVNDTCP